MDIKKWDTKFDGNGIVKQFEAPSRKGGPDYKSFTYRVTSAVGEIIDLRFLNFNSSIAKLYMLDSKNVHLKIILMVDDSANDEHVITLPYQSERDFNEYTVEVKQDDGTKAIVKNGR